MMKHLRLFEDKEKSEIEAYFQDKINWKIVNGMIDMTTTYEDMGYQFKFAVSIIHNDAYWYIWSSVNKYRLRAISGDMGKTVSLYNDHGLFYIIYIGRQEEEMEYPYINNFEELDDKISKRYNLSVMDTSILAGSDYDYSTVFKEVG